MRAHCAAHWPPVRTIDKSVIAALPFPFIPYRHVGVPLLRVRWRRHGAEMLPNKAQSPRRGIPNEMERF